MGLPRYLAAPRIFRRTLAHHIQILPDIPQQRFPEAIQTNIAPPALRWPVPEKMVLQDPLIRPRLKRHILPCVLMRAGTSKGVFIHKRDLPPLQSDWEPHLISALGSRGNDPRQIDGIGGGTSTTSKVAVVAPSQRADADVEWTFAQVAVGKESVDYSGTCGNVTSGVGPFALQEGIVKPQPGAATIDLRVYNTNTDSVVAQTIELDNEGDYQEDGTFRIPGVSTTGSEVKCAFVDPAGSMTGKLFPSGKQQNQLYVSCPAELGIGVSGFEARVTLIDAANPFVFIDATSISAILTKLPSEKAKHDIAEVIRRQGAVAMGLAGTPEEAGRTRGTPKVAFLYPPLFSSGNSKKSPDIRVQAYSMGLPHPSLQLTGAVCLAAALSYPETVASELSGQAVMKDGAPPTPERTPSPAEESYKEGSCMRTETEVVIEHSKGSIKVGVVVNDHGEVASCVVSRTARRLFEGRVRYFVQDD